MFKFILDEAFPILQKVAPTIATILDSSTTPALLILKTIILIAEMFKPDEDNFNMEDIKKWIIEHPESQNLLRLAEEKMKEVLNSIDIDTDKPAH